jgi:hypothetical protein
MDIYEQRILFLLVTAENPRWVDGRLFGAFQPIFDVVVVAGKYGVFKFDESKRWEFVLKSNN